MSIVVVPVFLSLPMNMPLPMPIPPAPYLLALLLLAPSQKLPGEVGVTVDQLAGVLRLLADVLQLFIQVGDELLQTDHPQLLVSEICLLLVQACLKCPLLPGPYLSGGASLHSAQLPFTISSMTLSSLSSLGLDEGCCCLAWPAPLACRCHP